MESTYIDVASVSEKEVFKLRDSFSLNPRIQKQNCKQQKNRCIHSITIITTSIPSNKPTLNLPDQPPNQSTSKVSAGWIALTGNSSDQNRMVNLG